MSYKVIECNPSLLRFDLERYPDKETSFIYEHLKYYCSKFALRTLLPSAHAMVWEKQLIVVSRHKYALIAQSLGVPRVRVVITERISGDSEEFLARNDVNVVDLATIKQEEIVTVVQDAWHVFFFGESLTVEQQRDFEKCIVGVFVRLDRNYQTDLSPMMSTIGFAFDKTCAEFTARTPNGDESWVRQFRQVCCDFHTQTAKIVSYQGRRFQL